MTQRIIEITSPAFVREEQLHRPEDLPSLFPVSRPLALEIGCGTGHFVVDRARQQPDTNFIAIDIYNKGCLKTCRKVDELGLDNVLVMRSEARYLLTQYLPEESLAAVYINCPDPWPKKRHRNRRLVNRTFLEQLLHYLQPGGEFFFSTDFRDYAEQVAALLPTVTGYRNGLESPWAENLPGYPLSKYMRRFLDLGQPIYFMHYRRCPETPRAELPRPDTGQGFRVRWGRAGNG